MLLGCRQEPLSSLKDSSDVLTPWMSASSMVGGSLKSSKDRAAFAALSGEAPLARQTTACPFGVEKV